MEIEYEGPNFMQEYRAALDYLHIVDGAQTRLGDTESEVLPMRVVKPPTALASPSAPSVSVSTMEMANMESEPVQSEFDLENPGPSSMQASEKSASHPDEGVNPPGDLLFRALARATRGPQHESEEQSAESKTDSKPSFKDKPAQSEGAVPSDNRDDKFRGILKRLGLST